MENKQQELIEELKSYISFLNEEINDLIGIAHVHGWRSTRVKEGVERRLRIEELEREIETYRNYSNNLKLQELKERITQNNTTPVSMANLVRIVNADNEKDLLDILTEINYGK